RFRAAPRPRLQRVQERDQVGLFLRRETNPEARVVELEHVRQCDGRAIVKVGSATGQAAENRALHLADIGPFAGDQRAPRVGGLYRGVGRVIDQREHWQITDV